MEQMAFDGAVATESESGWSLQNATVSVSTLMVLAAAAIAVWMVRWCFSKMDGAKKAANGSGRAMYGAI